MKYAIWSIEHNAWWKGGRCGYTALIGKAGQYEPQEALDICLSANKVKMHEVPVPFDFLTKQTDSWNEQKLLRETTR